MSNDLLGLLRGDLPQTGSFFGLGVEAVKSFTAASSAGESVTVFHAIFLFNRNHEATKPSTVREYRASRRQYARIVEE